ncbi:MAG: lipid-A-disaccharide synthase, partial [FCB group bacterium]
MKKIFIVAGDSSGDRYAGRLMAEIKSRKPGIQFLGIGGEEMLKAGLKSIVPLEKISVVGFWEVAKRFNFFRNLIEQCKKILLDENIDLFIPVDYPGFNIRLAGYAKKINIPVFYYIAPQLWAWGKNRAEKLAKVTDKLFVVFPFEVDFFKSKGINADFVGHPLLDSPEFNSNFLKYSERKNIIAFLPGSRNQEIKRHFPLLSKTADLLMQKLPDYEIGIGKSALIDNSVYE